MRVSFSHKTMSRECISGEVVSSSDERSLPRPAERKRKKKAEGKEGGDDAMKGMKKKKEECRNAVDPLAPSGSFSPLFSSSIVRKEVYTR